MLKWLENKIDMFCQKLLEFAKNNQEVSFSEYQKMRKYYLDAKEERYRRSKRS